MNWLTVFLIAAAYLGVGLLVADLLARGLAAREGDITTQDVRGVAEAIYQWPFQVGWGICVVLAMHWLAYYKRKGPP